MAENAAMRKWIRKGIEDPEEFCVHCGAKISGRYRTCPFCGKDWMR